MVGFITGIPAEVHIKKEVVLRAHNPATSVQNEPRDHSFLPVWGGGVGSAMRWARGFHSFRSAWGGSVGSRLAALGAGRWELSVRTFIHGNDRVCVTGQGD